VASLSRKGSRTRPKPVMNVTPLVDVVLVLLIIFMIVIPAMEESLDLEVPAVTNPDAPRPDEGQEPWMLAVTRTGRVYFDERPVAEGQLIALLTEAHAREPRRRLVIRGDRGVRYAAVRDLFSATQTVGFPGVSLRVNHRDTGARSESED
jgi:biopolymer transport protein TolR